MNKIPDIPSQLFNQNLIGIVQFKLNGDVVYANPALLKIFDYQHIAELESAGLDKLLLKPYKTKRLLRPLRRHGEVKNHRVCALTQQGKTLSLMINACLESDCLTATIIDVSDIEHAENRLWLFSQTVEQLGDPLAITDKEGVSLYINKAFEKITGYQTQDLLGRRHNLLCSGHHDEEFYKKLWSTVLDGQTFRQTFINRKKDGTEFFEEKTITPLKNIDGEITHFVSTGKDISYRIEIENKLKQLAYTDSLTNLLNRRALESEAERAFAALVRYQRQFAILMIDIDDFKKINDTYGHDVGDKSLKQVSDTLLNNLRKLDLVARWGGEEFLVLLNEVNQDQALNLAEKIRHTIAISLFDQHKHLTISIGLSLAEQNDNLENLIMKADKALYRAKRNGKNQIILYSPTFEP